MTITGYGFVGPLVNITMNGQLIFKNLAVASLAGGQIYTVPTKAVGTYTIIATDEAGRTASDTVQITATTTVTVTPASAPRSSLVTVEGLYYQPSQSLTILLLNTTDNTRVSTLVTTTTNTTGGFKATFIVDSDLQLDNYIIKANTTITSATAPFTVAILQVTVATGADSYQQGAIGSFRLTSSMTPEGRIGIYDPDGNLFEYHEYVSVTMTGYQQKAIYLKHIIAEAGVTSGSYIYPTGGYGLLSGTMFRLPSRRKTWQLDMDSNVLR